MAGRCHDGPVRVTQEYTMAEAASESEREAVCRAVLRALWPHLWWVDIDMAGLAADPRTAPAVARLQPYRTGTLLRRRQFTETAHLVPGKDDAALDAALDLAGRTVGSTGMA